MEYTKGEWKVGDKCYQGRGFIVASIGNPHPIAENLTLANALLISAAPKLYEELKRAATTIHNMIRGTEGEYRETLQAQLKEILKAIAKVEGDKLIQQIEWQRWRVINKIAWLLSEPVTELHYQISKN